MPKEREGSRTTRASGSEVTFRSAVNAASRPCNDSNGHWRMEVTPGMPPYDVKHSTPAWPRRTRVANAQAVRNQATDIAPHH